MSLPSLVVETVDLTKAYPAVTALHPCRLAVPRNEVCGLLGPNGAGKTTLLRLLLGFLEPTAGTARIEGMCCFSQREAVHAATAYLPGEVRLFGNYRGREILRFFADLRGRSPGRAEEIADRLQVDLSRRIGACSSGMRQKVALAATFAAETPLVILDEPTTHLDPTARGVVLELVREAHRDGRTVLFSSHIFSEVEEVCTRAVMLCRGRIVHETTTAAVRRRHRIFAERRGEVSPVPDTLAARLSLVSQEGDRLVFESSGDLHPILAWLAAMPLADVHVEPQGLQELYRRFAGAEAVAAVEEADS